MNADEILVFDTETNAIPDWKEPSDSPHQPHIVQLAAIVANTNTHETRQSLNVIIRPDDWVITPETIDIHGITNEEAMDVGIPEKKAVDIFMELLGDRLRVAHNTTFDNRIIRIGLKRFFSDALADDFKARPYYCTMINSRKVIGGKQPKLSEAYKHFTGKELEGAHTAMADAQACMEVYWAIKDMEQPEESINFN